VGAYFTIPSGDQPLERLVAALNGVTGWDFNPEEVAKMGLRAANLLRVFNIKHGVTPELEAPSPRYGSAPEEGVAKGKSVVPYWEEMMSSFYQQMGWDRQTGKPLPETLRALDLEHVIADL
jgi:aldehyde:ferredoxin oxidoreductase